MAEENQQPNQAEETVTTPTPEAPAAEAPPEQPKAEEKPEAPKPQRGKPFQERINQLTREKGERDRALAGKDAEIAALRAEIAAKGGEQKPESEQAPPRQPQRPAANAVEQFNQERVRLEAARIVQEQTMQKQINTTLGAGRKDYQDFDDRCNTLAALGAGERPEFLQVVTDPEIVPDGHKVLASLADDPQEAQRILSLPPVQMSAALVRYSENMSKPKSAAVSKAPTPIKPINGTAKASDEPSDSDNEDDWFKKRQAQKAAKQKAGASL